MDLLKIPYCKSAPSWIFCSLSTFHWLRLRILYARNFGISRSAYGMQFSQLIYNAQKATESSPKVKVLSANHYHVNKVVAKGFVSSILQITLHKVVQQCLIDLNAVNEVATCTLDAFAFPLPVTKICMIWGRETLPRKGENNSCWGSQILLFSKCSNVAWRQVSQPMKVPK